MNLSPASLDALLHPFSARILDRYPDSAFVCDLDGRLLHVNAAWRAFATENGAEPSTTDSWSLGVDVFSVIAPPLQPFYRRLFALAAEGRPAAQGPVEHDYECSSPTAYRRFHMTLYALPQRRGLVVVNARVVDRPHDPETHREVFPDDQHRDAQGMAHQCCHCRRVASMSAAGRWDWVPSWVAHCPPRMSHTLCEPCFAYYYASKRGGGSEP
jgi:hypothetical protein